ncbi:MAG TPA: replication initiator [Acidimicrobiales bacterium]|nr:replication initiator [Acidimicrobiales bacterium]
MNGEESARLLREVVLAGTCSHPVRLTGEAVNTVTGEVEPRGFKVACKDRRSSVCSACSDRYETDAWIIVAAGVNGGKGVPDSVLRAPRLFVTVTAPSFGLVHTISAGGRCVERGRAEPPMCGHGHPRRCREHHAADDAVLGHPLCDQCFEADRAVLWNASSSRLWSEMLRRARRNVATEMGLAQELSRSDMSLQYVKVVELQRRGLVHFHALVRLDSGGEQVLGASEAMRSVDEAIQAVEVTDMTGSFRFGGVRDIQDLGQSADDVRNAASYLAKYVTKTASGSLELAHRFASRRQISEGVADIHLRTLALRAWDLGMERHANTLGYRGQFLTKSRRYSTTFGELRAAWAAYWSTGVEGDPLESSYRFDGRGYDDPRGGDLAEVLAQLDRERRSEERRSRRDLK